MKHLSLTLSIPPRRLAALAAGGLFAAMPGLRAADEVPRDVAPLARVTVIRTVGDAMWRREAKDKPAAPAPAPVVGLDPAMDADDGLGLDIMAELAEELPAPAVEEADKPAAAPKTRADSEAVARRIIDGKVPPAGCREDRDQIWVTGADALPAVVRFEWDEPKLVSTVVYYGRSTWGFEVFKDYELRLDGAAEPVATGAFKQAHGAQQIHLPQPVKARKLELTLLSHYSGFPGVAAIQIFGAPPPDEALLARFTDFSLEIVYAYYPSRNLLQVVVPKPPADARHWQMTVRPDGDRRILAERAGDLPMSLAGESLTLPELPAGDYVLTLTFTGGPEPVIEERPFQRQHYEWEGQKLGLDDVVIPPFTPLEADAAQGTVACVLRQHAHGEAGLWRQVTSQGREILAGPVRLEAASGGRTVTAAGAAMTFETVKPTQVSGRTAWRAGAIGGTTEFLYDYDGLMQLTLRLPKQDAEVESLRLVIPLKASEAWLMHPVTLGLRHHYAGRIPAGEGRVWDSSKAPARFGGTFIPYIFVGGPERGICFAAENDRDWIRGGGVSAIEIERAGETVNLVVNLVAQPVKLARDREITFYLQATPAKPMPEEPYNWRRWWATGTDEKLEDVNFMYWGANMYWGGRHFASSVYPAFKDFWFWEQLAENRRTGTSDPAHLERWVGKFEALPPWAINREAIEEMRSHAKWGLEVASGSPLNTEATKKFRYVLPYTNPRGLGGETLEAVTTFIDEWQPVGIADPDGRRLFPTQRNMRLRYYGSWYDAEMAPTMIDFLLFYHKKMLETFADGIYWDNMFLGSFAQQPSFVPAQAGGPAYVGDDGRVYPGVSLMGTRNLVRRLAVMMHVMGKRPLSYSHMTNTHIVPVLSFGTFNLDWEWRDHGGDAQRRVGADACTGLILAQTTGLQSGNIGVAINRFGEPWNKASRWPFRTVMATCIPHEIKIDQGSTDVKFVQEQLTKFGYGLPDCKVYRYWDENYPLKAEGAKIHALVLARGGRAMLAIGNYGPSLAAAAEPAGVAEQAPTLEAYDARQRGRGGPTTPAPARPTTVEFESYKVRLTLDLKALGLPETAQAYDVELRAGREKAENLAAMKRPELPGLAGLGLESGDSGLGNLDLETHDAARLRRRAPGVFELPIVKHDFALILVGE